MRTKTLRYYIEPKAVHRETVASTRALFIAAMKIQSSFCGLRFIRARSYNQAQVRIRFADNTEMQRLSKTPGSPLGLQMPRRELYFNLERGVNWEKWAFPAFAHEFGHMTRMPHSRSKNDLMHKDLPVTFWSRREIIWWQKKFTPRMFTPPDVAKALAAIPNNAAKKAFLKSYRLWAFANINVKI